MAHPAIRLSTPKDFDFWSTVFSHGWSDLAPFQLDRDAKTLSRVFVLSSGRIVAGTLSGKVRSVSCTLSPTLHVSAKERVELTRHIRTILRLDEDMSPFHREVRRHPAYRWIAHSRAGRLLRAPTMFEDAVKMICTTNCTWALTTYMVRALMERFGASEGTNVAFPDPAALAGTTEEHLRKHCSTGYRSRAIHELAEKVAGGKLDVEGWRTSPHTTSALFAEMCAIRGIGPYTAGNLLKLVGRYEYLGLDSWVRKKWCSLHTRGRKASDRTIERYYAPYGTWRGLLIWLEVTRDWHDDKFP
jgi:N-glycosylase/DNA lyase